MWEQNVTTACQFSSVPLLHYASSLHIRTCPTGLRVQSANWRPAIDRRSAHVYSAFLMVRLHWALFNSVTNNSEKQQHSTMFIMLSKRSRRSVHKSRTTKEQVFYTWRCIFMFCWPCISICACNETNLMHYLSSVYSITIHLYVSGLLVVRHLEVTMYIYDNW
jgi:hypothetical protein